MMQATRPVSRLLYKSLLRRAKLFDKFPLLKALYHPSDRQYYVPFHSFQDKVRQEFRSNKPELDLSRGFEIYRMFGSLLAETQKQIPWFNLVEFDPTKITEDAPIKISNIIEPGTILISHPLMSERAVFMILRHDSAITTALRLNVSSDKYLNLTGKPGELSRSFFIDDIVNEPGFNITFDPRLLRKYYDRAAKEENSDDEEDMSFVELSDFEDELIEESSERASSFPRTKTPSRKSRPIDIQRPIICDGGYHPGWVVIHNNKYRSNSEECGPGLYYTCDNKAIKRILKSSNHDYRVFNGFSCFDSGSLLKGLHEGVWILAQPNGIQTTSTTTTTPTTTQQTNNTTEKIKSQNSQLIQNDSQNLQHNSQNNSQSLQNQEITKTITKMHSPLLPIVRGPLEEIWPKTLMLMGGEFYHFAHIDTAYPNYGQEKSTQKTL